MKKNYFLVYGAFAISLVILVFLSIIFFRRFDSLVDYSNQIDASYRVITQLDKLEISLKEAETGQRGYFLTEDSLFLQPYLRFSGDVRPAMDSLETLLRNKDDQRVRLSALKYYTYVKLGYLQDINLAQFRNKGPEWFRRRLNDGRVYMDSIRIKIAEMSDAEHEVVNLKNQSRQHMLSMVPAYFGTIFIFAVVVFLISFLLILRSFKRRLRDHRALKEKVQELDAMNKELEEITYAASHDLQEPMRKIRTFANRLILKQKLLLDEEGKLIIGRMDFAAMRMQELIDDLVGYTSLFQHPGKPQPVDLNKVVKRVLDEYRDVIDYRGAVVEVQQLPVVQGYGTQLFLLFKALIDNAFKFSKKQQDCFITIEAGTEQVNPAADGSMYDDSTQEAFFTVTVRDNGIGFSEDFAEKIFMIFRRLHNQSSEYEGKGIGLAMVRRIMLNHRGTVRASGQEGQGASFLLYFPVHMD